MANFDLYQFFDRIYVINLDRRPDRWQRFLDELPIDWPFGPPFRFTAVDGIQEQPVTGWNENLGAWGCYRSHLEVLKHAIDHRFHRILIFEDDAVFCAGFAVEVRQFIQHLPHDWALSYLGGQHIELHQGRPTKVNEMVYAPFNANRLHAYSIQGLVNIRKVYDFLAEPGNWTSLHHVDHFLGAYQKQNSGIYCPRKWLVAQDCGVSDIALRDLQFRVFLGSEDIVHPRLTLPMVAVIGPFGSGTSVVTGALHHMGISMGRTFEIQDSIHNQGCFESVELTRICRQMFNEPWMTEAIPRQGRVELLKIWAAGHTRTFGGQCTLVGGKHPSFCLLGDELTEAWDCPHVVSVERAEKDIISSLARRNRGWPLDTSLGVTHQLIASKEAFLSTTRCPVIRVEFESLKRDPLPIILGLQNFLNHETTAEAVASAVAFVRG